MKKFAQVLNGKLHWKFQQEAKPEFAEDILIVEITDHTPEPQEGWEWNGSIFTEPKPQPLSAADVSMLRANAYRTESDPLYFKAQRGEATMEEWQAKVQEIKDRYPDPAAAA